MKSIKIFKNKYFRVEDWEYEFIDMNKLDKTDEEKYQNKLDFETVCLPYRFEPSERGRLRVRRGRVTMEHNGRLKTVNIGFKTNIDDKHLSNQKHTTPATPWNRDNDKELLLCFKKHNGDPQKTIEEFLNNDKTISPIETSRRLDFLMDILKKVTTET